MAKTKIKKTTTNAKTKKINKKRKNTGKMVLYKLTGGIRENYGFPPCNIVSQFKIFDNFISEFQRSVPTPKDCFINALQLTGLIDSLNANIMRVSSAGITGFTKEAIEKVFILIKKYNFDFKSTKNFNVFIKMIYERLLPGHAIFAGYDTNPDAMVISKKVTGVPVPEIEKPLGSDNIPIPPSPWYWKSNDVDGPAHIFILARKLDGGIYYIDPQLNLICNIDENSCVEKIKLNNNYFLLFNSTVQITPEQARLIGIIL
jgi:hypothetical protein